MRRLLATIVFALASAASARAEVIELNANAGFDEGLAGVFAFAPPGGNVGWTAGGFGNAPGSGALALTGPAGRYVVRLCLSPQSALPGDKRSEFRITARVGAPQGATVVTQARFGFGGDAPGSDAPCDGPLTAELRRTETVAPSNDATPVGSGINTNAWPQATVELVIDKVGDAPLLVDDWRVSVDTDVVFRDEESPAYIFSM